MGAAKFSPVAATKTRLIAITPYLHTICRHAGVASASIGILYEGETIHNHNIGFSNIEKNIPTTTNTIYGIGSMTKAFISLAIAQLIHQGCFQWDTCLKDILPNFAPADDCVREHATITDMLCHMSGLSPSISLAFQGDGEALLYKDQIMSVVNGFEAVSSIRKEWIYNTWGYSIAAMIIMRTASDSLPQTLNERIFAPLGLKSTSLRPCFNSDNTLMSEPYATLADGTNFHLPKRMDFADTALEGGGGIFSNVEDLLEWARMWLGIGRCQPPLTETMPELLTGRVCINPPTIRERSYAPGGWIRTQLPNTIGLMGDNAYIYPTSKLPEVGHGASSELNYYHQGSTVGYFSQIILIPGTRSAIVVLTNSIALGDGADWLAQACLQALLGDAKPVNYVDWSSRTAKDCLRKYEQMRSSLQAQTRPGTMPRDVSAYIGQYYNKAKTFSMMIAANETATDETNSPLKLYFLGRKTQGYALHHLHDDTFEFSMERDEAAKRGRFHEFSPEAFILRFNACDGWQDR
jgi:CubicO group peptidase (beta-lactamase class C family)